MISPSSSVIRPGEGRVTRSRCASPSAPGGVLVDRLVRVVLGGGRDRDAARRDEAGEIVDVAVGMVVHQPRAEPDDALEAEVLAEPLLDLLAGQLIAVGVEQALLGRQHACPIRRRRSRRLRGPSRPWRTAEPRALGEPLADVLIAVEVVLPAPAVEPEALRRGAPAAPSTIGPVSRSQMSPNGSTITSANGQSLRALSAAPSCAATSQHLLALAAGMHRLREGRDLALGRLEIAEPQFGIARKADPDRLVRRPFRWGREEHRRAANRGVSRRQGR